MRSEDEIKKKIIKVKDYHKYGAEENTPAYLIQDGFITALEWVLQEDNQ